MGNNIELSTAEVKSVLPHLRQVSRLKDSFFLYEGEQDIPEPQKLIDSLGGVIRIAQVFEEGIAEYLAEKYAEQKRIIFGIYSEKNRFLLLRTKKQLVAKGFSVRFVNRNWQNLDAGTVHKEQLLGTKRAEILHIMSKKAATIAAQDVEKFAQRDFQKPVRDMQVGMLPPKLAMILLNLTRQNGVLPQSIWDPFCGTGTVLVEAGLLGMEALGSDINPKMIEASRENFQHFFQREPAALFEADAGKRLEKRIEAEAVCCETYLGPICRHPLSPKELEEVQAAVEPILENFFRVLHENFTGNSAVIALPFWQMRNGQLAFLEKALDIAQKFWKNGEDFFGSTARGSLLFRRKNQNTGREIFVFDRR